jgi:hypothetical protein
MSEVTAHRTPVGMGDVHQALLTAWRSLRGETLPVRVAALLLALVDLETATGASVKNYNLGNIVATDETKPYFVGLDSGNTRRFRAYGSLADGARSLISQLTSDTRKEWRNGLLSGNPHRFVESLGGVYGGPLYFEAPLETYRKAFMGRWERYAPNEATTVRPPVYAGTAPRGGGGLVFALALLAAAGIAAWKLGGAR